MNSFVSVLYAENLFVCALSNALNLKYCFLCGHLSITERWRVVGFCPHATRAGVFGINLRALVPIFGSFEGGLQHNEPGNRTIMLEHSHLAIERYNFKFRQSPKFGRPNSGRYPRLWPDTAGSSLEAA